MLQQYEQPMRYGSFCKGLIPSIFTMIFLSFYTTIDGFFVSRYVGSDGLAGINIVIPITCLIFGLAIMLATGAGAILGERLGRGQQKEANQFFSLTALVLLLLSLGITVLGLWFLEPIVVFLGASPSLLPHALPYGAVIFWSSVPMSFKLFFEYLVRTDGSPKTALWMSSLGLIFNLIFDYLFVVLLNMGTLGAALGTLVSILVSMVLGLFYFVRHSHLQFACPRWEGRMLWRACTNGSSEMLTELSTGVTTFLFNILIFSFYGENGVAAITILMYLFYFFLSFYMGITVGAAPIISYNLGRGNGEKMRETVHYSLRTILLGSLLVVSSCYLLGPFIIRIFTPQNPAVFDLAWSGLQILGLLFLFIGENVFFSGHFTALGRGGLSALISFLHTFLLVILFLIILPPLWRVNGIWAAIPCAEFVTLLIALPLYLRFGRVWREPPLSTPPREEDSTESL